MWHLREAEGQTDAARRSSLEEAFAFLGTADELHAGRALETDDQERKFLRLVARGSASEELLDVGLKLDQMDFVEARALLLADWASQIIANGPETLHAQGGALMHCALTFLGRVELRRGERTKAVELLARSEGLGHGSEEIKVLGPYLALAQELADAGEREAVVHYLTAWSGTGSLLKAHWDGWIHAASIGGPIHLSPRRDT